jgi:hypothetical protein
VIVKNPALMKAFSGPGLCSWCGKAVSSRDPHHVVARGIGGGKRLDVSVNIVSLCTTFSGGGNCHHMAHNGREITKSDLLAVIAAREECLQDEIEVVVWLLLRLPKDATDERVKRELSGWNDGERRLWARVWSEITGVRS